jgi:hypothetical protein
VLAALADQAKTTSGSSAAVNTAVDNAVKIFAIVIVIIFAPPILFSIYFACLSIYV